MSGPIGRDLLPEGTHLGDDDVEIGGVSLRWLAERYATPLFVYDEASIRARAREAAAHFDDGVAYASKAFLCGAVARLVVEEGLCIDVATGGELDLVLRSGISAARVIVHGNNKSDEEVSRALDVGVHRFVVDSFYDVQRLAAMAGRGRGIDVLVRVTPGVEAHTHEFVRTGQEDSKFGLSIATGDARRALDLLRATPGVRVRGVHAHIGSQIFETTGFVETMSVLGDFCAADDFEEWCVGGGLGVGYVAGESAPTIEQWARACRHAMVDAGVPAATRLLAEPGRALVARAAVTLYRVGAMKRVPQREYLAVDGGMSDNPRPVLYGSGYEVFDVSRPLAERPRAVRVVGKHCESGDVIVDEAWIPDATTTGDLIATPVTGAYGYSMASNYNRVPRPAVVFVAHGTAREVLRRENFDDLARLEC